jgi:IgA Peptidase M64
LQSRNRNRIGAQQHHRRLFLNGIFEFFFSVLSSSLKTCRKVGDSFETRERLDIFSYLIAITIGGEKAGPCEGSSDRKVGQVCGSDGDCIGSGVCRSGVCLASKDCNFLIHTPGDPFDQDRIVLIFVGSAFTSHEQFTNAVINNFNVLKGFEFFAEDVRQYHAMYVLPSDGQRSGICTQPCDGIDRLLCCDVLKSKALSDLCFSSTTNVQTLVLHNSNVYGGAGYPTDNIATATIISIGPRILVHEVGHSLLSFGDEYTDGTSTNALANCDNLGCSKWSDLIPRTISGYNKVGCISGKCAGGRYYVGERSYMEDLTFPIGAVNARFSCCAYLSLTKSTPSYGNKFEFTSGALLSYCRDNDYQGFGRDTYTRTQGRIAVESTLFTISIPDNNADPIVTRDAVVRRPEPNRGIVFFPSLKEAFGRVIVLEYKLSNSNSSTRLFLGATTRVHVPLPSTTDNNVTIPDDIRIDTNFLQIEVESNLADIEFATVELVDVV